MASNGNERHSVVDIERPWATARLVSPEEIPGPLRKQRSSKYAPLYHEISLRLEKTPPPDFIAYDFQDAQYCKQAVEYVRKWSTKDMLDVEITMRSDRSGGATLFVRRGPKYQK